MANSRWMGILALGVMLAGCSVDLGGMTFVNDRVASIRITTEPAQIAPDGTCPPGERVDPATVAPAPAIALGITECDLLRLKAATPTDVAIGESGRGEREVQVLYAEPGGRELYLFTDNRLVRMLVPGQGA